MKPLVKLLIPKTIPEESYVIIRSAFQEGYTEFDIHYELTEDVSAPTVSSFSRNEADLGRIDNDPDAPSVAIFRGMQITLNKIYRSL
jgi:hypothetical protein